MRCRNRTIDDKCIMMGRWQPIRTEKKIKWKRQWAHLPWLDSLCFCCCNNRCPMCPNSGNISLSHIRYPWYGDLCFKYFGSNIACVRTFRTRAGFSFVLLVYVLSISSQIIACQTILFNCSLNENWKRGKQKWKFDSNRTHSIYF